MKYLSTAQAATRWGISQRRVALLCEQGRIDGAQKAGHTWIIPDTARKPQDARIKTGKYVKQVGGDPIGDTN
ncbi:hypothetical protein B5F36_00605 [Anaerofilum sp. An201]|nr:hypothetical protein [Anaerofilum sp. An201]OUP05328.1 hypothetical protein B5F36_00605 [Anaerofilum sp. An201]